MADDPQTTPTTGPEGDRQGEPATGSGAPSTGTESDPGTEPTTDQTEAVKAAEKRAADAEAEAARLRRANAAVKGVDLDALRAEVRTEFTEQLVRAEVRAAAAGRLRDASDALALLDLSALAGPGGEIDGKAVTAALEALVKAKPYLAADASGPTPAHWGDVGAGQRGTAEPEPASPYERLRRAYSD
ncbi:hypothetical protein ACIQWA_39840 [Kitasatospora sp. NPDC098652]|uniref:hypothetical protein n=1 Tax=Kitasatospora sp. NPDC098652 TaxID=3364095 RepID=UPI003804FE64